MIRWVTWWVDGQASGWVGRWWVSGRVGERAGG